MKFIVASIAGFLIVFLLCSFSAAKTNAAIEETVQLLEAAAEAERAGNKTEAQKAIERADRCWKHHSFFLEMVLRHDEIDDSAEEFARLASYATTEDRDDFLSNCKALITRLRHIQEMEKPTFQNIM